MQLAVKDMWLHNVLIGIQTLKVQCAIEFHRQEPTESSSIDLEGVVFVHVSWEEGGIMTAPNAITLSAAASRERW